MEASDIPPELVDELEEYGGLEGVGRYRPDEGVIARLGKVYSLLSARSRIEILYFLNFSRMTPGMLNRITGMAPNLLSFHLRKLESAGIIKGERMGRFVVYGLTDMGRNLSGPLTR
jgi:DNA-binding transcriptional ArsR family regulator